MTICAKKITPKITEKANGFCNSAVKKILYEKRVAAHFQPIVAVKNRSLMGFEALVRVAAYPGEKDCLISPALLFATAAMLDISLDFDRLCRDRALEAFAEGRRTQLVKDDELLFLNMDTSIIDKGVVGSGYLINSVLSRGLKPKNIVIEICEAGIRDINALLQFVRHYKEYGFAIALDDIGVGFSNLDRILFLKPDILKLDRCLIEGIDKDCYKQEIVTSIINLSKRIGTLVVAEGIETEAEAVVSSQLGADLLQGYYFCRPQLLCSLERTLLQQTIDLLGEAFKKSKTNKIAAFQRKVTAYSEIIQRLVTALTFVIEGGFEAELQRFADNANLEYLYILNGAGIQVTDSISKAEITTAERNNFFFHAACQGTDQSLKTYYLSINAGMHEYISEPYISYASGNLCITIAKIFSSQNGGNYILCADFAVD